MIVYTSSFCKHYREHRAKIKLPRSMEDAKVLGEVLEIYEQHYYYEVLFSFFFIYILYVYAQACRVSLTKLRL